MDRGQAVLQCTGVGPRIEVRLYTVYRSWTLDRGQAVLQCTGVGPWIEVRLYYIVQELDLG